MGMTRDGLSYWQAKTEDISLIEMTIGDLLDHRADEIPMHEAVVYSCYPEFGEVLDVRWTYQEYRERATNEVVSPPMLEERVLAMAQELLSIPFTALLYTKRQIDRAFGQDTETLLHGMTAVYEHCLRSPEHAAVKAAYLTASKKTT